MVKFFINVINIDNTCCVSRIYTYSIVVDKKVYNILLTFAYSIYDVRYGLSHRTITQQYIMNVTYKCILLTINLLIFKINKFVIL